MSYIHKKFLLFSVIPNNQIFYNTKWEHNNERKFKITECVFERRGYVANFRKLELKLSVLKDCWLPKIKNSIWLMHNFVKYGI